MVMAMAMRSDGGDNNDDDNDDDDEGGGNSDGEHIPAFDDHDANVHECQRCACAFVCRCVCMFAV